MVAICGVLVVLIAIALNYLALLPRPATPPSRDDTAQPADSAALAPSAETPEGPGPSIRPTFDVVRVSPNGDTVIAGRATPGDTVTVMSGDQVLGEARADIRGEWVFVPPSPLPPGAHRLTLSAEAESGAPVASEQNVVVIVAEASAADGDPSSSRQPLAIRLSRSGDQTVVVLQPSSEAELPIAIDAVEVDREGRLAVTGQADPGATVRVYLSNRQLGDAVAGADGVWTLKTPDAVEPGDYTMRVDEIGADGRVIARAATGVDTQPATAIADRPEVFNVERGANLWQIARDVYGQGTAYTVIYEANREQIRDPNLIYPGQVFDIPVTGRDERHR
jgi:nucleoid-associated protein YgaU